MPLYILIGERHDDTANSISLVDQLLKSCEAKGLKAVFYPEDQSLAHNKEVSLLGNRVVTVF
jgi:hypothetical protein